MDTFDLNKPILDSDWRYLQSLLPAGWQDQAFASGAIERKRAVKEPAELLRMLLAYGFCNLSLRSVAAWAQLALGIQVSDVAVLKRLKKAVTWLEFILNGLLSRRVHLPAWSTAGRSVHLIDATCVSRPGSVGTDWRIHLSFNLDRWQVSDVQITDSSGGESLTRFAWSPGQVCVGDRGYVNRAGIWSVVKTGACVLVRMNWQNLPLEHPEHQIDHEHQEPVWQEFNLFEHLRSLEDASVGSWNVRIKADPKAGISAVEGRVIAIRKSEQSAEESRRKLLKEARKKGSTPTKATLEAAGYIFVFTTLAAEEFCAGQVLELYRFRWQIELVFKRMKSLFHLDAMTAKDGQLCRAYLLCKLIGALLIEDLSSGCPAFSPWGYGTPPAVESLAGAPAAG